MKKRFCFWTYVFSFLFLFLFFWPGLIGHLNAAANAQEILVFPKHRYRYEGTEVSFEVVGVHSSNLKWDFGDGRRIQGGRKQSHVFNRPGLFKVEVVDPADPQKPPVQVKVNILREDRRLVPDREEVIKGTAVQVEAQKFIDKYIKWNFGDGTPEQRGGQSISHTFTRTGTFKIKAVDFDGKGSKKIMTKIRIIDDRRLLELPKEILEGEPVSMSIKNAPGGQFVWEFSDGRKQTGTWLKSTIFKNPGTLSVVIKDKSGKYPPLSKQIIVKRDNRQMEAPETFALPDEDMEFKPVNFKGRYVQWNFGDGTTTRQSVSALVKHKFKKPGKYRVTAVDFSGNSLKKFSQQIQVGELSPGFRLTLLELAFDNGKYYRVADKDSISPRYYVRLKAVGRGILRGKWLLDGSVIGLFEVLMKENRAASLDHGEVVSLPVIDQGLHYFTLEFSNYSSSLRIPIIRYFVAEGGEIEVTYPVPGEKIPARAEVLLKWRLKEWKHPGTVKRKEEGLRYEIAVSEVPFQFLRDDQIEWREVGSKGEYGLKVVSFKDWVYWQVRQVGRSGRVLTTSDMASFKIKE
jgi:hypothetical protein